MGVGLNFQYCPCCGSKLIGILGSDNEVTAYLCRKVECRTVIQGSKVARMTLESFSRFSDRLNNIEPETVSGYMLLNEKGTGPLFVKNSNDAFEKHKDTYCIVKAESIEQAIKKFKSKYKYINITEELIVPIIIKEV